MPDEAQNTPCLPKRPVVAFLISFTGCLLLYLGTMAPSVTLEYSGYFAAAADNLGIPNSPGFPIWTLLSWVWIRLIELIGLRGDQGAAWSLNLFSVICGALTCGLIAALIVSTIRDAVKKSIPPAMLVAAA